MITYIHICYGLVEWKVWFADLLQMWICIILGKLYWFTTLNSSAIKGDDFPILSPMIPRAGENSVRSWWNWPRNIKLLLKPHWLVLYITYKPWWNWSWKPWFADLLTRCYLILLSCSEWSLGLIGFGHLDVFCDAAQIRWFVCVSVCVLVLFVFSGFIKFAQQILWLAKKSCSSCGLSHHSQAFNHPFDGVFGFRKPPLDLPVVGAPMKTLMK